MKGILDIRVQYLFVITLILKIGTSFLGWYINDPWILGFSIPLFIMIVYIVLGYFRHDTEVTDEKFADSCYYLGFIFTITSIIFSLIDLPNIGTKIQEIAVRFGTAMVSTVLGLGVRVTLVSFKKDVADAIKDAEDGILDATKKFTEQLIIVLEKLHDFEIRLDNTAKSSVERVNLQIENLSKNHADKLSDFFMDLTDRNQKAFISALEEVKTAYHKLSESIDGYSQGMQHNINNIDQKISAFTDAVTERLKTTAFPDDYFAKHLQGPLSQLKDSACVFAESINSTSDEVKKSATALTNMHKRIQNKSKLAEDTIDTVIKLSGQQQLLFDSAQGQIITIGELANTLMKLDTSLSNILTGISNNNIVTSSLNSKVSSILDSAQGQIITIGELTGTLIKLDTSLSNILTGISNNNIVTSDLNGRVSSVVEENETARKIIEKSLADILDKLESNSSATDSLSEIMASGITVGNSLLTKLDASLEATGKISIRIDNLVSLDLKAAKMRALLEDHAKAALDKFEQTVQHLNVMANKFSDLESSIKIQNSDLKSVADNIKDLKAIVEIPKLPTTTDSSSYSYSEVKPPLDSTNTYSQKDVDAVRLYNNGTNDQ